MGLCRKNADKIQLDIKDRVMAMETLLRLNKIYKGRISANAGPLAEAKMWIMMERSRRESKKLEGRGCLVGCGGVLNKMAVRADGVMVPCSQLSHIELGRVNRDSLKDVWQNHAELMKLRGRRNIPLREFEFCGDCYYIDYCTGNCPALSYTITGEVYHPSPDACLKRFLDSGGRLPSEELLGIC